MIISGDLNGHVGCSSTVFEGVHGNGVGNMNNQGKRMLEMAQLHQFKIENTQFAKRENHLVTYNSGGNRTPIDYIPVRDGGRLVITNCKTLPFEGMATQHRVLIEDLLVKNRKGKIRW